MAEDDLADVMLLERAFARTGVKPPVYLARNGQEVRDYLGGNPPFENPVEYPLPNLLLLDLNLPRVSGFEVLSWIRGHPALNRMLVVVLSASDRPEEIRRAYELGANSYVVKPHDPAELVRVVERVQNYWLGINTPPGQPEVAPETLEPPQPAMTPQRAEGLKTIPLS